MDENLWMKTEADGAMWREVITITTSIGLETIPRLQTIGIPPTTHTVHRPHQVATIAIIVTMRATIVGKVEGEVTVPKIDIEMTITMTGDIVEDGVSLPLPVYEITARMRIGIAAVENATLVATMNLDP